MREFRSYPKPEKRLPKQRKPLKRTVKKKVYNGDINKWFEERIADFTGVCQHCGGKTELSKVSAAHILPKSKFKSIATNENNCLELCFYGNSCHDNFDRKIIPINKMRCWPEIVIKFKAMYNCIAEDEKRFIPVELLKELK